MTSRDDGAYWTVAEAVVWACTRKLERVEALAHPAAPAAVGIAMIKYAPMGFIPMNDDGSPAGEPRMAIHADYVGILPHVALRDLIKEGRRGRIRAEGKRCGADRYEQIRPIEFVELDFRLVPGHPGAPIGLWSKSRAGMAWTEVQVAREDVMRMWPPQSSHAAKTAAAEHAIVEHLRKLMRPEAPLTKPEAKARCLDEVPGAYPEAFEKAWKKLPPERKRGRGKHGPRAH